MAEVYIKKVIDNSCNIHTDLVTTVFHVFFVAPHMLLHESFKQIDVEEARQLASAVAIHFILDFAHRQLVCLEVTCKRIN